MGTDRDASREHLLARLHKLRTIVPVFAHELASARHQAAQLRAENRKLVEQVRLLQRRRVVKDGTRVDGTRVDATRVGGTRVGARDRSSGELGAARSGVALGRSARARRAGDEVRIGQR